ncbi:MAG: NADH-quinone oxidoreductase subunit D [Bacteriovoracia bacterium]
MVEMENDRPDLFSTVQTAWELGPFHPGLPGPMALKLQLDGEMITGVHCESGFFHRGVEKAIELQQWYSVMPYADRIDSETALFTELAVCLAVEEIAGLQVSPRANRIRVTLCELNRISAHLGALLRIAKTVELETVMHYVLRDREKILDLFELISGSRFNLNYFRFGGVATDITDGFIERVSEVCDLIRTRVREYQDLFTSNHIFQRRSAGVGLLHPEVVRRYGITGPDARASGVVSDMRKSAPYSGYEEFEFQVPVGSGEGDRLGGVHDRVVVRLREIVQSVDIIRQAIENIPVGEYRAVKELFDFKVPEGEAYSRVEGARGVLAVHAVSDGGNTPYRLQVRGGSKALLQAVPEILVGQWVGDFPLILASLDISVGEADR